MEHVSWIQPNLHLFTPFLWIQPSVFAGPNTACAGWTKNSHILALFFLCSALLLSFSWCRTHFFPFQPPPTPSIALFGDCICNLLTPRSPGSVHMHVLETQLFLWHNINLHIHVYLTKGNDQTYMYMYMISHKQEGRRQETTRGEMKYICYFWKV